MKRNRKKFKRGAASFYIVAFSSLILVVIATSFATVTISEMNRTSNDDLSQSAYDAALAGVEDAKVAFANYRRCAEAGTAVPASKPTGDGDPTCSDIMYWMAHPDCYMVGRILGKIKPKDATVEVTVGGVKKTDNGTETTTNQAYTCTQINTNLSDYRATLSSNNMIQVIRAGVGDTGTNNVRKMRISWHSVRTDTNYFNTANTLTITNSDNGAVRFISPSSGNTVGLTSTSNAISVPPTLEVQLVQTNTSFTMAQFDEATVNGAASKTNRATLFLVPSSAGKQGKRSNYIGAYNTSVESKNLITAAQVAKTNDHTVSNRPFVVYCDKNTTSEFFCSVDIELPAAVGTTVNYTRANQTFMIAVSLPYQQPDTDFSIELICNGSGSCGGTKMGSSGDGNSIIGIKNTQISIDSTGRANDLYRRVETRMETSDTSFGFGTPSYALQILGSGATKKSMRVTSENNFYF